MSTNVAHMREVEPDDIETKAKPPAAVPTPAIGYSILANLGDEKQLTMQCFVAEDEELASIHRKVDRVMAVVDRQKAKYKKRDLEGEKAKLETVLRRLEADLIEAEAAFERQQEAFNSTIKTFKESAQAIRDQAAASGRVSGPVGASKAEERNLETAAKAEDEKKKQAQAERDAARQNAAENILRYREEISKCGEQIAECEALIDGG